MLTQLNNVYTQNGARLANDCFNFQREYEAKSVIHSLTYLLKFNDKCKIFIRNTPDTQQILRRITETFESVYTSHQYQYMDILHNLADIYLTYSGLDTLIDRLSTIQYLEETIERNREPILQQLAQPIPIIRQSQPRKFHEDSQNVHNKDFNISVLTCAKHLKKMFNPSNSLKLYENDYNSISDSISNYCSQVTITRVFDRIKSDPSTFNIGCTLEDVLLYVWMFIQASNTSDIDELYKRLGEEFTGMVGLCATGHLARLVNTIQGFTTDTDLMVTISPTERISKIIKSLFENHIMNAPEEVINGMTEQTDIYKNYILSFRRENIQEWIRKHGPESLHITRKIIIEYCMLSEYIDESLSIL
jgi:hypothetical protein